MQKVIVLSQCCSVTGIRVWGKLISGRSGSRVNADAANNQQIVP